MSFQCPQFKSRSTIVFQHIFRFVKMLKNLNPFFRNTLCLILNYVKLTYLFFYVIIKIKIKALFFDDFENIKK